jgi:hypothetical protein
MYDWFDANGRRHRGYAPTKAAAEQLGEEMSQPVRHPSYGDAEQTLGK